MDFLLYPFRDVNGSVWCYDARRHPSSAALHVRHRICADQFAHVLAWFMSLVAVACAAVYLIIVGVAMDYFIAIAALAGANWFLLCILGEWAMRNGQGLIAYLYVMAVYGIWVSLLWLGSMVVVNIRATQVRAARRGGGAPWRGPCVRSLGRRLACACRV